MSNFFVGDVMRQNALYVFENDDLFKVVTFMRKFNIDVISVIDDDFSLLTQLTKDCIKKYLKTNFFLFGSIVSSLKNIKVKDVMKLNDTSLVFYPTTKAEHAFSLMKYLKSPHVPVVETPLDKKLVGFISMNDICKKLA